MKTIQTILEKFERKFEYGMCERENVKTFIAAAFDEYKKELREAVERTKVEHHHLRMCKIDEFTCAAMEEAAETRNQALDSVLELLK